MLECGAQSLTPSCVYLQLNVSIFHLHIKDMCIKWPIIGVPVTGASIAAVAGGVVGGLFVVVLIVLVLIVLLFIITKKRESENIVCNRTEILFNLYFVLIF